MTCAFRSAEKIDEIGCPTCGTDPTGRSRTRTFVFGCSGGFARCTAEPTVGHIQACRGCTKNTDPPPPLAPRHSPLATSIPGQPPGPHHPNSHAANLEKLKRLVHALPENNGQAAANTIAEFEAAVQNIPETPAPPEPHGVLYVAGGWRFFASLYVSVKMLRASGCDWPIAVRYFQTRGEFEPRMAELLPEVRSWLPIEAIGWPAPFRPGTPGGWQAKPLCLLHSPFQRTIYLDADCYPIRNPAAALAEVHGAAFWPDWAGGSGIMRADQFAAVGLPFVTDVAWESGQIMVDMSDREQRRAIRLATWLAFRPEADLWSYGDKDNFQMAYRRLGTPFWQPERPQFVHVAYVQAGSDCQPLFVHRCRDKFRVAGLAPKTFETPQSNGTDVGVYPEIPGEDQAHGFFHEYLDKMGIK